MNTIVNSYQPGTGDLKNGSPTSQRTEDSFMGKESFEGISLPKALSLIGICGALMGAGLALSPAAPPIGEMAGGLIRPLAALPLFTLLDGVEHVRGKQSKETLAEHLRIGAAIAVPYLTYIGSAIASNFITSYNLS